MKRGVILIIGVVFLVIIGVIAIFAARSDNKAPAVITLKVWSPFEEADVYKTISQSFLEKNPNVKLEFKYIDAADAKEYEATVVDAIASGEGPDVWLIRTDWLPKHEPKLASSNNYVKWSTNRKVSEQEGLAALQGEAVAEQNVRQGQVYGVPLSVDSLALYVNKKVINQVRRELDDAQDKRSSAFDQYPTTWPELEAWSRLVTKTDKGNPIRSGLALGVATNTYAATDVFAAILQQQGGALFTDTEDQVSLHLAATKAGQTNFPGQSALALYSSFGQRGNQNFTWPATVGNPVEALISGRTAMVIGYSTLSHDLLKQDKNAGEYITIRPFPQFDPLKIERDRSDFAAYWTHVVPKNRPNVQLSWQYLRTLTVTAKSQTYAAKTGKPVVPDQGNMRVPSNSYLGDGTLFTAQVHYSYPVYKPEWQQTDEALQDMLSQVIAQGQSVQAAIDSAAEKLKKLLSP